MSDYPEGHVKRDPVSGAVAIRTNQPESSGNPLAPSQAWLVATTQAGPAFVGTDVVSNWDDLELPE